MIHSTPFIKKVNYTMKVAIINDSHAGVKNGSDIFLDYSERFYENVFFPYLLENDIKKIIHLGDYFEHRKYVNFKVLRRNYEHFIAKLEEYDIQLDIIAGNHDVYWKNTNDLNSIQEILRQYDNITIYDSPTVVDYDGCDVLLLPWICEDNYDESIEAIKTSKATILGGHLELAGFEMMRGIKSKSHGMGSDLFSRYEIVMSGHFHTKSTQGNIHYLGTQLELTWSDANDNKYFHVLDTDTRVLTPIRNPDTMFHKLVYDEDDVPQIETRFENTYVKVVVLNKKNLFAFDQWYDKLIKVNPFEIKIVESFEEYLGESIEDDEVDTSDTPTLLNSYIDTTETQLNKDILKKLMHELYVEAQNMTDI